MSVCRFGERGGGGAYVEAIKAGRIDIRAGSGRREGWGVSEEVVVLTRKNRKKKKEECGLKIGMILSRAAERRKTQKAGTKNAGGIAKRRQDDKG